MSVPVDDLLRFEFPQITFRYTERDVSLYALGVGAPADPLDQAELAFVYERSGEGFRVLPTFAALFPGAMIDTLISGNIAGFEFNPMMLVHGEQYLEVSGPLPTRATITCTPKISAVYDKGSGALIITDVACHTETGEKVALIQSSMFIRGAGGWGGERGPSAEINVPPDREPDAVVSETTLPTQALIYRLSGDINPLHADPMMAALGGFDRPILHGLASFGFAGRAVLRTFCGNDPARFRSIKARFAKPVFPGETLTTEMWQEGDTVIFRTRVIDRDVVTISNAAVVIG